MAVGARAVSCGNDNNMNALMRKKSKTKNKVKKKQVQEGTLGMEMGLLYSNVMMVRSWVIGAGAAVACGNDKNVLIRTKKNKKKNKSRIRSKRKNKNDNHNQN